MNGIYECIQTPLISNTEGARNLQTNQTITISGGSNTTTTTQTNNTQTPNSTVTISSNSINNSSNDECCGCDCSQDSNPLVDQNTALKVLLLNIFLPGVGTMLAACRDPTGCNCKCFNYGVWQMLLSIVGGSIWAIVQGAQIY